MNYPELLATSRERMRDPSYFPALCDTSDAAIAGVVKCLQPKSNRRLSTLATAIRSDKANYDYLTGANVAGLIQLWVQFGRFDEIDELKALPWIVSPAAVTKSQSHKRPTVHLLAAKEVDALTAATRDTNGLRPADASGYAITNGSQVIAFVRAATTFPPAHETALHNMAAALPEVTFHFR